jgi:hypothetical protein
MVDGTSPDAATEQPFSVAHIEQQVEHALEAPDGAAETPATEAEPATVVEVEPAPASNEIDREAILQDIDDMRSRLDAMRARFEGVAAEDPMQPIESTPPVDDMVVNEAASTFVQPEAAQHTTEFTAQTELIDGAPGVISGRSGVLDSAPVTPGWTEDPNRPGVLTRPVDESNPADVALRDKKIAQGDQLAAMSAAAVAEARARNEEIVAAQAKANQPIPGGIEVPDGMLRQVVPEAPAEPQPIITAEDVPTAPLEEAAPAPVDAEAPGAVTTSEA